MPQEINWSAKAQVLEAVTSNGENLEFADYSLRSDREVVMAAVTGYQGGYGRALLFASESLRNDIEIARVAVSSRGCTLEFASKELKADPEIVM